jgi:hypothetical protein
LADVVCLVEEVLYLAMIAIKMLFYHPCVERIHGSLFSDSARVKRAGLLLLRGIQSRSRPRVIELEPLIYSKIERVAYGTDKDIDVVLVTDQKRSRVLALADLLKT